MSNHDSRVAVFGSEDRIVRVYHERQTQAGLGMTVCGRLFDSTCRRKDANRAGLQPCRQCAGAEGRRR